MFLNNFTWKCEKIPGTIENRRKLNKAIVRKLCRFDELDPISGAVQMAFNDQVKNRVKEVGLDELIRAAYVFYDFEQELWHIAYVTVRDDGKLKEPKAKKLMLRAQNDLDILCSDTALRAWIMEDEDEIEVCLDFVCLSWDDELKGFESRIHFDIQEDEEAIEESVADAFAKTKCHVTVDSNGKVTEEKIEHDPDI